MGGIMEIPFVLKALIRARHSFSQKEDVAAVVEFVKEAKVPGVLQVSFAGNGGITSIEFLTKEKVRDVEGEDGI